MDERSKIMSTIIDISQSQPTLSELLKLTASGQEVVLVSGSQTIATLSPAAVSQAADNRPRTPGLNPNWIEFLSDDWDEPLPDEFWLSGNP